MAANRSTKNAIGCRSHRGANSDRKIATPTASGVAMINASAEETIVPKIAGAAPKCPLTASHSLPVKNANLNCRSAGQPATNTSMAIRQSRSGMNSANAVVAIR